MRHPAIALAAVAVLAFSSCTFRGHRGRSTAVLTTSPPTSSRHETHFAEFPYAGDNLNTVCVACHSDVVAAIKATSHWKWEGAATNLEGMETLTHGKTTLLNNFCIAIGSNEGRCTQCHIGVGWSDKSFDHEASGSVDCLCCHDTTGTYSKGKMTAGAPVPGLDWARIGKGIGKPTRSSCGKCHYNAGGGDNVKHGDLAANLNDTTRTYDVHMGRDGGDFACQECHGIDAGHGIGGMPLHSVHEGEMKDCADCHAGADAPAHDDETHEIIESHPTLSCQVCHIPAIARFRTTMVEWRWSAAGDAERVPADVGDGRKDYDKKKGEFVWAKNVRPTLRRHNRKWKRMVVGARDTYTTTPAVLGEPAAPRAPAEPWDGVMIYPFKKMVGDQVADVVNKRVMVPHLFGRKGGPNPYWVKYDWNLAVLDGSAYTGQPYASGDVGFVDTVMYLAVNHEVAPKEQAYGRACTDCHAKGQLDWAELGYPSDPCPDP
jgi:octaheme c-type cytochrome (tetrathionate reductase family)